MNKQEFEEKLAELRKKYRDLLREGRTEDATEVYLESERVKESFHGSDDSSEEELQKVEDSDEEESSLESFEELKGVGDELANALQDKFGSLDEMSKASVEDLEPVPGIGKKRAESLLDQLN